MASWFHRLRRYLSRWVAERQLDPNPPTHLPADHEAHLVKDGYGESPVFCCKEHDDDFERRARALTPAASMWPEHLTQQQQREHITRRLGSPGRDDPRRDFFQDRLGASPPRYPRR